MSSYYLGVWIIADQKINQDLSDLMTGRDLWLCIDGRVVGGFHLRGLKEGFYYHSGESIKGNLTHFMLREDPPPPPYLKF